MKCWCVSKTDSEVKLVAFLREKLGDLYSTRKLKQAIENNLCFVNSTIERFASFRLKAGDRVQFDETAIQQMPPKVFVIENDRILYEDDALLLYDKPVGLTSDETGLAALFSDLHLVHRLDRETTGVIMFAKTEDVKQSMVNLFRKFEVEKVYMALVDGVVEKDKGVIENFLGKVSTNENQVLWGVVPKKRGKFAKTLWELVRQGKQAALVRCHPETGRTHQIRIHMRGIGHPVLGDFRYARKFHCSYHAKRCMLHALKLSFPHPVTGKLLLVEAPLPWDFKQAMEMVLE